MNTTKGIVPGVEKSDGATIRMLAETEPVEGGLTLSQARLSLVSPELRQRYDRARAAFDARDQKYPGWRNSRTGYIDETGRFRERPDPLTLEVIASTRACELEIQRRLADGELLAWGARGSVAGERVPIRSYSWDEVRLDFARSRIRAKGTPPSMFFDVRIFEAGRLPSALKRKPVTEAIHEAYQRLKSRGGHRAWTTKVEAYRAIRNEVDGRGDDRNARRMVDEVLGAEIEQVLEANLAKARGEMAREIGPENKG